MSTLSTVLTSVLMTTVGKVVSSFGMSLITYTGLNAIQKQFVGFLSEQFDNFPAAAVQLIYIAGGGVALNWIFGAITFLITLKTVTKFSMGVASK